MKKGTIKQYLKFVVVGLIAFAVLDFGIMYYPLTASFYNPMQRTMDYNYVWAIIVYIFFFVPMSFFVAVLPFCSEDKGVSAVKWIMLFVIVIVLAVVFVLTSNVGW